MSSKKWNNGPPPSIGWWPASLAKDASCLRWWDGRHWSCGCYSKIGVEEAERRATRKETASSQSYIQWLPRPASWPARSHT